MIEKGMKVVITKAEGLKVDQNVEMAVKGHTDVMPPCNGKLITFEDRLARFDPKKHGGEVMDVDHSLGAEQGKRVR